MLDIKNNDDQAMRSAAAAVVDFSATWCPPCQKLAPIIHELAADFEAAGTAAFFGLDVDDNGQLAAQFGIEGVPTVVVLKNGQEVDRKVGFHSKEVLRSWIEDCLEA